MLPAARLKHLLVSTGFVLVAGAACSQTPLGLSIAVPSALSKDAVWIEIGAYRDASCNSVMTMLGGGIPNGYEARYAFRPTDATQPDFGNLPNAKYAFAAVARDESCAVIAKGCTNIDAGSIDNVAIGLAQIADPRGGCAAGSICEAAQCTPAVDNSNASVGAGCSLELLGAGPLASSAQVEDTLVSAPAIAATKDGFMIVYREIDVGGGRLILLPIDSSGGAQRPLRTGLDGSCSDPGDGDGIGLVINGNDGIATFSKQPCMGTSKAALALYPFSVAGSEDPTVPALGTPVLSDSPNPASALSLGPAKAQTTNASNNLIVFTQDGIAQIAHVAPPPPGGDASGSGIIAPNGNFGSPGTIGAWISANDKVMALLSVAPGDPNADDGTNTDDGGVSIGTTSDTYGRLLMLDPATDVQTIATTTTRPFTFPAKWASLASSGKRVIVVSDGGSGSRSVSYAAYDFGATDPSTNTGGFQMFDTQIDPVNVTAGDVAILGTRAFMVGLQQGQVALAAFDNATNQNLTPIRTVNFSQQTRISGISTVRDGSVAVAVTDSRVAVVWTTAKKLTSNDADGGYAVFACTP